VNIRRKKSSVVLIVGLLCFCWVSYIVGNLLFIEKKSENIFYVPKDSNSSILVDSRLLVGETAFSLLFTNDNFAIFERIQKERSIRNRAIRGNKNKETLLSLGINTLNKVVVFTRDANEIDSAYTGFIFNLNQDNLWDRNLDKVIGKQQVGYRNGNVGIILSCDLGYDKTTSGLVSLRIPNKSRMLNYAQSVLRQKNNQNVDVNKFDKNTIAKMNSKIKNSLFSDFTADVQLEHSSLGISGVMGISEEGKKFINTSHYLLNEDGLQISTCLITPEMTNVFNGFVEKFNFQLPVLNFDNIQKITVNYKELSVIENNTGYPGLPKLDVLLELKDSFNISDLNKSKSISGKMKMESNTIDFGSVKYYVKQIDAKTIYFGVNPTPIITKVDNEILFHMRGDLSSLTKVKGKGITYGILTMNSVYSTFQKFFDVTKEIDLKLIRQNNNEAIINGSMTYQENKSILVETLNFILQIGAK
jgi:hypothetical protein